MANLIKILHRLYAKILPIKLNVNRCKIHNSKHNLLTYIIFPKSDQGNDKRYKKVSVTGMECLQRILNMDRGF